MVQPLLPIIHVSPASCLILIPASAAFRCLVTDISAANELDEPFLLQDNVQQLIQLSEVSFYGDSSHSNSS